MAESKPKPVKKEENASDDDDNIPISSISKPKPIKKQHPIKPQQQDADDDDDDNVPLAFTKSKKKTLIDAVDDKKDIKKLAKPKREEEDEDDHKVRKEADKNTNPKPLKVKKGDEDAKKEVSKTKKKKKKVDGNKSKELVANGDEIKQRIKKVYDLPGQKHDPPEERDPLRIFYETLYDQMPSSEMAAIWMMERGLLPAAEAKKVYEKKLKKIQHLKIGSPAKAASSVKKASPVSAKRTTPVTIKTVTEKITNSTTKVVSKKRKKDSDSESDGSDDDFEAPKKKVKK